MYFFANVQEQSAHFDTAEFTYDCVCISIATGMLVDD